MNLLTINIEKLLDYFLANNLFANTVSLHFIEYTVAYVNYDKREAASFKTDIRW